MLDDDIVFLGSTNPTTTVRAVTGESFSLSDMGYHSDRLCLVGIVLHVEKRGNVDGFSLTFRKANTTVVHIGRRSGFEADKRSKDQDPSNAAMFRCAVVSRKHAKIAFSDIGQVFLLCYVNFFSILMHEPARRRTSLTPAPTTGLTSASQETSSPRCSSQNRHIFWEMVILSLLASL